MPSAFSQNVQNELDAYNSAKKENKIATYKSFSKQFPKSDYLYEIDTLCSNLGLKYADSLKTIPGYLTFLDSFPSSIYSIDVVHKILVLAVPNFSLLTKLADVNKAIATIKQLNDQNNFGFAFDRLNHFSEVDLESGSWTNINLNVSHFANGDSIPEAKTNQEWIQAANDKKPAWCYYDNNPENGSKYGKLYNRHAISDPRGLSSANYKLPSYNDYVNLVNESGGLSTAGKQLKCPSEWDEQSLEDEVMPEYNGFSALPGGYRDYQGNFVKQGEYAVFWTGEGGTYAKSYMLIQKNYSNALLQSNEIDGNGYSVRLKSYFDDSEYSSSNVLNQLFLKRDKLLLKEYGLIKDGEKVAPFLFNQIKSELGVKHLKKEEINEAHYQFVLDRFYSNTVKNGIFLVPPYFYDYMYCGSNDGPDGIENPPIMEGFKDGILNYIKYENGDSYTGETSESNYYPSGKGTIKWINGDSYTGEFTAGYPTGKGTKKWKNGVSYTGDVSYGEPNGKGTKTFPNGTKEIGDFVDGEYKKPFQCKTATIGNQVWMAENLKITTFRNGDPIPEVKTAREWELAGENKQPAFCYYNNDPKTAASYGVIYNWYAFSDNRGLAPNGWRIPSLDDVKALRGNLEKEIDQVVSEIKEKVANGIDTKILNQKLDNLQKNRSLALGGTKLKSKSGWKIYSASNNENGSDVYGFNAKPTVKRDNYGTFEGGTSQNPVISENPGDFRVWTVHNYKNGGAILFSISSAGFLGTEYSYKPYIANNYGTGTQDLDMETFDRWYKDDSKAAGYPVRLIK